MKLVSTSLLENYFQFVEAVLFSILLFSFFFSNVQLFKESYSLEASRVSKNLTKRAKCNESGAIFVTMKVHYQRLITRPSKLRVEYIFRLTNSTCLRFTCWTNTIAHYKEYIHSHKAQDKRLLQHKKKHNENLIFWDLRIFTNRKLYYSTTYKRNYIIRYGIRKLNKSSCISLNFTNK